MEVAKLILEYLKVLAWPIIAGICVLVLRNEIKNVFNKISDLNIEIKGFKLKMKVVEEISKKEVSKQDAGNESHDKLDPKIIWSLSDDDFVFINNLSGKEIQEIYYPTSTHEEYRYNSLCNEKIFSKNSTNGYKLTAIGNQLLSEISTL